MPPAIKDEPQKSASSLPVPSSVVRPAVGDAPSSPTSQVSELKPSQRPARELLDYLAVTGTPAKKLREAEKWLIDNGKQTTCEQMYRHLEAHDLQDGVQLGTLRKAGKFCFGDGYEPERGVSQVPAEEMVKLREENEQLKKRADQANSAKLSYLKQRDIAVEQRNEAVRKLAILKAGRSREELAEMGIEDGVTVTA